MSTSNSFNKHMQKHTKAFFQPSKDAFIAGTNESPLKAQDAFDAKAVCSHFGALSSSSGGLKINALCVQLQACKGMWAHRFPKILNLEGINMTQSELSQIFEVIYKTSDIGNLIHTIHLNKNPLKFINPDKDFFSNSINPKKDFFSNLNYKGKGLTTLNVEECSLAQQD